jgi:cyanophycinase-like exopeptidase
MKSHIDAFQRMKRILATCVEHQNVAGIVIQENVMSLYEDLMKEIYYSGDFCYMITNTGIIINH